MATGPQTLEQLLLPLCEMGFSEDQINAAISAGCFTVSDAAEWILQNGERRHTLLKHTASNTNSLSAFNLPKTSVAAQTDTDLPSVSQVESEPVKSRMKQNDDFIMQQREREAKLARTEKIQHAQEKELILMRIAQDRRAQQEKTKPINTTNKESEQQKKPPSTENGTVLMIRLPSGESLRLCFPSNSPLREVVDHVTCLRPSLPPFSLVHGFPRRCFSESDLSHSLQSLGLSPNAALVLQILSPSSDHPMTSSPTNLNLPVQQGAAETQQPEQQGAAETQQPEQQGAAETQPPVQQGAAETQQPEQQGAVEPHPAIQQEAAPIDLAPFPHWHHEEAAGLFGVAVPPSGPSHRWGHGQRLVSEGNDDDNNDDHHRQFDEEQMMPELNVVPHFLPLNDLRPQHHWPNEGHRLGADTDPRVGEVLPGEAAMQRLQRQDFHPPHSDTPVPHKKPNTVPKLITMATNASVSLIKAPCKQYVSSLACLTPELAERLLDHLILQRELNARTLQLFFGCSIGKLVLNSYPYTTNTLLQQLGAFSQLTNLSLVNSALITDTGLSVVSKLVKLQNLNVSFCIKLTDACLNHIIPLRNLSVILLDGTKVGDAGMHSFLHSFPSALSHLSLNHTRITETTLEALSVCVPQLRLLSITHTTVCDVSSLVALQYLHTLQLDFTRVQAQSLHSFSQHPTLSTLSLCSITATHQTLSFLSGLNLTRVTLPGRDCVTDATLSFLSTHTLLCELDLSNYTHISDAGIAHLTNLNRMRKLALSNTGITDVGLLALQSLTNLTDLYLNRTAVTSRGVAHLISHTPYLQVLGLSCTQVGDTVLKSLKHCTDLIKLDLSRTRITDRGLRCLFRMNLTHVNLDGTGVTTGGVNNLLFSSSSLSSVRANQTRALPPEEQSDDEELLN